MAYIGEVTAQVVALTDQVQTLTARVTVAEQNVMMSVTRTGGSNDSGVFDKERLYPKELKETSSFRSWSEWFIAWVAMDSEDIARAFHRAGKQEQPLDTSGLTELQASYSRALYGHLRALTEGYRKAAKIVRLVKDSNGLEAWRRVTRKFDPQSPEVHAAQLEHIVMFGNRNAVKQLGDTPTFLDQFQVVLDDYEEATGDVGINIFGEPVFTRPVTEVASWVVMD